MPENNENIQLAWQDHSNRTGHTQCRLFWPRPVSAKQPHPHGWKCLQCDAEAGEVPR